MRRLATSAHSGPESLSFGIESAETFETFESNSKYVDCARSESGLRHKERGAYAATGISPVRV